MSRKSGDIYRAKYNELIQHVIKALKKEESKGRLYISVTRPWARAEFLLGLKRSQINAICGKSEDAPTASSSVDSFADQIEDMEESVSAAEQSSVDVTMDAADTVSLFASPSTTSTSSRPSRSSGRPPLYDDFERSLVRRTVLAMYAKGQLVTMKRLRQELGENAPHETTLGRILREQGFRFKKRGYDLYIREKPDIARKRRR